MSTHLLYLLIPCTHLHMHWQTIPSHALCHKPHWPQSRVIVRHSAIPATSRSHRRYSPCLIADPAQRLQASPCIAAFLSRPGDSASRSRSIAASAWRHSRTQNVPLLLSFHNRCEVWTKPHKHKNANSKIDRVRKIEGGGPWAQTETRRRPTQCAGALIGREEAMSRLPGRRGSRGRMGRLSWELSHPISSGVDWPTIRLWPMACSGDARVPRTRPAPTRARRIFESRKCSPVDHLSIPLVSRQSVSVRFLPSFVAMATTAVPAMVIASTVVPSTSMRSSFSGAAVQGLPALKMNLAARPLTVTASTKKIKVAQPLGECGAVWWMGFFEYTVCALDTDGGS